MNGKFDDILYAEEYEYDDILCHHGVKGQKWGIRRTLAQLGHKISSTVKGIRGKVVARRKQKAVSKKDTKWIRKHEQEFTNDELRKIDERFRLRRNIDNNKMVDAREKLLTVSKVLSTGVAITASYNTLAKVYNSMSGAEKLPTIDKPLRDSELGRRIADSRVGQFVGRRMENRIFGPFGRRRNSSTSGNSSGSGSGEGGSSGNG